MLYPHVYILSQVSLNIFIHIKYRNLDFEKISSIATVNMKKVKSGFIPYKKEIPFVESRYLIKEIESYMSLIDALPQSKVRKDVLKLRLFQWGLLRATIIARQVYNSKKFLEHYNIKEKRINIRDLINIYHSFCKLTMFNDKIFMKSFGLIIVLNNLIDNTNSITYKIPRNPIKILKKLSSKL